MTNMSIYDLAPLLKGVLKGKSDTVKLEYLYQMTNSLSQTSTVLGAVYKI